MGKKDYSGIDYSLGTSNVDKTNGIHYGTLHQNRVHPEAVNDIYQNGRDLSWEQAQEELKDQLEAAILGVLEDTALCSKTAKKKAEQYADDLMDDIGGDALGDGCGEAGPMLYEDDGYEIQTDSHGDLIITKSPYYTRCQFASPCFPGGGYLDNPCENGPKTYCLGPEWFAEKGSSDAEYCPLPYPVYSVADDSLVATPDETEDDGDDSA